MANESNLLCGRDRNVKFIEHDSLTRWVAEGDLLKLDSTSLDRLDLIVALLSHVESGGVINDRKDVCG